MRTKKSSSNAIMSEMKNLAAVGGGVLLGAIGGKMVDKVLKVDETITGFNIKKLAKPAAQLGLGIIGAIKLKNPQLKMFSAGVGATGIVSAANVAMNKNLLAGIPGLGRSSAFGLATSVYEEPMQLSVGRYNPDLPQLYPSNNGASSFNASEYGFSTPVSEVVETDFEII